MNGNALPKKKNILCFLKVVSTWSTGGWQQVARPLKWLDPAAWLTGISVQTIFEDHPNTQKLNTLNRTVANSLVCRQQGWRHGAVQLEAIGGRQFNSSLCWLKTVNSGVVYAVKTRISPRQWTPPAYPISWRQLVGLWKPTIDFCAEVSCARGVQMKTTKHNRTVHALQARERRCVAKTAHNRSLN